MSFEAATGSFWERKKKSSLCGPYFPGTFQKVDAVRKHTVPRVQARPDAFPKGPFAHHLQNLGTYTTAGHCNQSPAAAVIRSTRTLFPRIRLGLRGVLPTTPDVSSFFPKISSLRPGSLYSCRQIHLTRVFLEHFHLVHTPHCGSKCLWCAFTPSACHP